jgi:hypothetical protein
MIEHSPYRRAVVNETIIEERWGECKHVCSYLSLEQQSIIYSLLHTWCRDEGVVFCHPSTLESAFESSMLLEFQPLDCQLPKW